MSRTENKYGRLQTFLVTSFVDSESWRRYLLQRTYGSRLRPELPDGPIRLADLVWTSIQTLESRCLIDRDFFADLALSFPQQADEVEDIARQWNIDPHPSEAAPRRVTLLKP